MQGSPLCRVVHQGRYSPGLPRAPLGDQPGLMGWAGQLRGQGSLSAESRGGDPAWPLPSVCPWAGH